jgi:AraC-like DNA-binding protein/TolB-like protein/Tfp pilus assembly protein PilF
MSEPLSMDQALIRKLTDIVLANLQDENFGVDKLAEEAGLSRFTIHRRIKSIKKLDVSQFIREVRLQRGMEMLQNNEGTIAEIAFRVGFSSPAYFTKCFREYYGYPPGKVKGSNLLAPEENIHIPGDVESDRKKRRLNTPYLIFSGIAILALFVIFFIYPGHLVIFNRNSLQKLQSSDGRISVAVMPFQNMTNDTTWSVWQDGIQNNLITSLSSSEELKVRSLDLISGLINSKGITRYASITRSVASNISQKLNANVYIYGSISQAGSILRLNAQLIDSNTEEVFKTFQIDGKPERIISIIDSLSCKIKDFLIISKLKKDELHDYKYFTTTDSPEAYRNFIFAENSNRRLDFPTAINYYLQAIATDSNFTAAVLMLSIAYFNNRMDEQAKKWCLKVYDKRDKMPLQQKIYTNWVHAVFFETPQEEIKYLRQIQRIDDQLPTTYFSLGNLYNNRLFQYDKAIPELEKALELYQKFDSKPKWARNYTALGLAYHRTGQYSKEHQLYKKAELDFPDDPTLIYRQAILSLSEADTNLANRYITKYKSILKDQSWSESEIASRIGDIYGETDILRRAEEYYRFALINEPQNPIRLYILAYFLIDNDQNIDEGMDLVERALKFQPDNSFYLDCKGWGLYKQDKYHEALEVLQKSWDLKPRYIHQIYLHLEAAKKAVAGQR